MRFTPQPILPVTPARPQNQCGRLGEEQNLLALPTLACNGKLTETTCDVTVLHVLAPVERVA